MNASLTMPCPAHGKYVLRIGEGLGDWECDEPLDITFTASAPIPATRSDPGAPAEIEWSLPKPCAACRLTDEDAHTMYGNEIHEEILKWLEGWAEYVKEGRQDD